MWSKHNVHMMHDWAGQTESQPDGRGMAVVRMHPFTGKHVKNNTTIALLRRSERRGSVHLFLLAMRSYERSATISTTTVLTERYAHTPTKTTAAQRMIRRSCGDLPSSEAGRRNVFVKRAMLNMLTAVMKIHHAHPATFNASIVWKGLRA